MLRRFFVVSPALAASQSSSSSRLAAPALLGGRRHLQAGVASAAAAAAAATPAASDAKTKNDSGAAAAASTGTDLQPTRDAAVDAVATAPAKTGAELLRQQAEERHAIERARREELSGSVSLPRNTKVADDRLTAAARDKVSKITVTASHVVQQSGTWQTRGDVIGVSEAGVPIVHRDPDVAVPESYATPADLTETYFELPEGFDQNRFYIEVARENLPMATLWTLGMLGYWYSWPTAFGWPAVLAGTAAVQRLAARFGAGSVPAGKVFCDESMRDKICVVTGASSGIGLHAAIDLARRGAAVICSTHSRSEADFWKAWDAALPRGLSKEQREELSKRVSVMSMDLCEFASVRTFADFVIERVELHCKAHGRVPTMPVPQQPPKKAAAATVTTTTTKTISSDPFGGPTTTTTTTTKTTTASSTGKKSTGKQESPFAPSDEGAKQFMFVKPAPLDLLINNAGLLTPEVKMSSIGFESHIAGNVLGPIYLTELLLPHIRTAASIDRYKSEAKAAPAAAAAAAAEGKSAATAAAAAVDDSFPTRGGLGRIVNVTSMAHVSVRQPTLVQRELLQRTFEKDKFNHANRYAVTKLLNIYYTDHLARRGIRAVSVTPGGVASGFFRNQAPSIGPRGWAHYPSLLLLRTPREGANNLVYAALCRDKHFMPGGLYTNCGLRQHAKSWMASNDRERNEALDWIKSQMPLKSISFER